MDALDGCGDCHVMGVYAVVSCCFVQIRIKASLAWMWASV